MPLSAVAPVSIKKVALQPACDLTTPISSYPKMLPKPAIPSMIPETVARALWLFNSISYLPKSHSIAAMIIDEPLREAPRKNMTMERSATLALPESFSPQSVSVNVEILATKIPSMKTGDLIGRTSVLKPIKIFPQIAPTPNRLKIFADTSFEKLRQP